MGVLCEGSRGGGVCFSLELFVQLNLHIFTYQLPHIVALISSTRDSSRRLVQDFPSVTAHTQSVPRPKRPSSALQFGTASPSPCPHLVSRPSSRDPPLSILGHR